MVANVGRVDRLIRLVLGAVLLVVPFVTSIPVLESAVDEIVMGAVGVVLIVTAAFRFCPLYRLLGMATCRTQSQG